MLTHKVSLNSESEVMQPMSSELSGITLEINT